LGARAAAWPPAIDDLLTMSGEEFGARFGDTAIERTRRGGLARNAAIVARNTGAGSEAALVAASADSDPAVAGAARRALAARVGRDTAVPSGAPFRGVAEV
jgi:epoxyqueuosine reductase QueG